MLEQLSYILHNSIQHAETMKNLVDVLKYVQFK